jgi:hypothetical protein
MRARGLSGPRIADWLQAEHGITVTHKTVENLLEHLRGARAGMVLCGGEVQPLSMSDDEVLQRLLGFEMSLFEKSETVPEKRAASRELLRIIELKRKFPVQGDGSGRDSAQETNETLKDVLAQLKAMTPREVIAMPVDSTHADEIDKT